MKVTCEINNLTKKRIDPDFIKKIVRKTVKLSALKLDRVDLSVVFVTEGKMKQINRQWRKKNKSTDVLSFRFDLGYNKKRKAMEGELVLCPSVIAKNARENEIKFERELGFVVSHGVLHIMGWKHGPKMYQLQDTICE